MKGFLGIDVGSVSTNIVFIDENKQVREKEYAFTHGRVLNALKRSLNAIMERLPSDLDILGTGVTGSAGELARSIVNADLYKTEIYSHARATVHEFPDVKTIFEIGGQDSKVIYVKDGVPVRSRMNEWCGAGTGSMLDAQSSRLGVPIEQLGALAIQASKVIDFRTRCGVFIESCAIDAQARGYSIKEIAAGLCHACAKNFIGTLHIDRKKLETPIVFQGGVAGNVGVKQALERYIEEGSGEKCTLLIPKHHDVMGALGIALSARDAYARDPWESSGFRGMEVINKIETCIVDANRCGQQVQHNSNGYGDILELTIGNQVIATL
jgi:predicted CoA-substrate-specific enzyme activase